MYLALTFDDGPSPQYTPRLLDGLKQRGVHATFFLIGQQVQDYPELVQRIRAEGHQIGNHTYDHAPLDRLSCGEAMADLSRCDGVLQELAGEGTYWVRPPYGFITEEELAAWSTPMLYWSVDTCDWECRDVQKVFAAICQARDGDVILLHDCYGTSVEAALQAIDCLSEQGVEFVTVEELFALRGQTAEARASVPTTRVRKMGKRRSPKQCFGDLLSTNRSYRPAATMQFSTSVRITKMAPTHLVALASLASTERALLRLM